MLFYLFWVISRRQNVICRRFGTLCSIRTGGVRTKNNREEIYVHKYPSNIAPVILPAYTTYEDGTECSETSAYKIQAPGNHPK